ncbi:MAG: 50S ribosomal protein L3 [Candidatus Magasanikbacteria bacterium RIFCSPLOWO2_01_FULL_43_20b]|uniref:Large ribosomal subunit protein uL3 n=1 Tax=Candidatus Magasanikbacteria bacterium RIFCSPLOWO2_12_FULL_43_12 TaxID=1798692 RepID=A0A1F6MU45_9BACT|nr:MAG: 50S ribosomal protein L3 [Candidatus Magasanikbacteria bacterium RIFCSPHIGHO2_02_FULL_44_13]OGH71891.1 MAG: 50S ribosomal protein L3 [Candidatus Magasanikbacteria bacterium RIFCSPLOWO2_02_FULL_43_22]OGH73527.1 MAG: 50S ribosomal protein L3 [Candidatus Magasanikbacteria bacterium RIFCSPLOWO2_01_FULL_43_20b]OGH75058.1 MAG: 50S ribosomal protein L3 [Candidatus Magasanikbacteria bacterium RIFCSPLOWO2_12_FULL_43_12]
MKFILGKKLNMLQVFREDGTVVPVTKVEAGPCVVTQIKTADKNGVSAVQIGFGAQKRFRLNKPALGHLKGINVNGDETITVRMLRDQRVNESTDLKRGDVFSVKIFTPGEKVQVIGTSKGKGFQGVVKRHGFHGGPATHGHKDNSRAPGSIGAGGVQRVFKGMRMAGHMGDARITVKNLEIVSVHPETNEVLIKGALPGARGGIVLISTNEGKIEIEKFAEPAAVESVVEQAPEVNPTSN